MSASPGVVYLVGAGPGAPDLITVRGQAILSSADVVVYDRLTDKALLQSVRIGAELIDMGKCGEDHNQRQEKINRILVDRASQGLRVVRLKGGDPLVFGRGFEEAIACHEHGIASVIVPGVTSALAAPAVAGIPLTERHRVRSFTVITASVAGGEAPTHLDKAALAQSETLVVLMGRRLLTQVASRVMAAGWAPDTPVACIQSATLPTQKTIVSTLATVAQDAERQGLVAPVVTVVGEVAARAAEHPSVLAGPLQETNIVLTRPLAAEGTLAFSLRALGASVTACPMVRIAPVETDEALRSRLNMLAAYDWVLFTSFNAVDAVVKHLLAMGKDARAYGDAKVAAVGPSTARALKKIGIAPDLIAEPHSAEGLVATLDKQGQVNGKRMLCPHSNRACSTLAGELTARGASVDSIVAYRNEAADVSPHAIATAGRVADILVFCSPSAVNRAWELELLAQANARIACIGPTTAAEVARLGLTVDMVPENHTAEGLVQEIVSFRLLQGAIR